MRLGAPPLALSSHEAYAPWKSPAPLLWKPRSRVFCHLDADHVPQSKPPCPLHPLPSHSQDWDWQGPLFLISCSSSF